MKNSLPDAPPPPPPAGFAVVREGGEERSERDWCFIAEQPGERSTSEGHPLPLRNRRGTFAKQIIEYLIITSFAS